MIKLGATLLEQLDEIPPKLTRIIARKTDKWRTPLTNEEIASRSGLSKKRVGQISRMSTWADLTVSEIDAFRSACGITPRNLKTHRAYIKRALDPGVTHKPFRHLEHRSARTKALKGLLA